MGSDFERFRSENRQLVEDICRDFFNNHDGSLQIKKEALAVKNLENILNSALQLSSRIGFQTMSLRDLSRESGLSLGALYTYFKNKDDLLRIIHRFGVQAVIDILSKELEGGADSHGKLLRFLRAHLYLSEILQPWFSFMFMETKNLKDEDRKIPIESELLSEKLIEDVLKEGKHNGVYSISDTSMTASIIKAMLQDWYLKRGKYAKRDIPIERYLEFVTECIEKMILNKKES